LHLGRTPREPLQISTEYLQEVDVTGDGSETRDETKTPGDGGGAGNNNRRVGRVAGLAGLGDNGRASAHRGLGSARSTRTGRSTGAAGSARATRTTRTTRTTGTTRTAGGTRSGRADRAGRVDGSRRTGRARGRRARSRVDRSGRVGGDGWGAVSCANGLVDGDGGSRAALIAGGSDTVASDDGRRKATGVPHSRVGDAGGRAGDDNVLGRADRAVDRGHTESWGDGRVAVAIAGAAAVAVVGDGVSGVPGTSLAGGGQDSRVDGAGDGGGGCRRGRRAVVEGGGNGRHLVCLSLMEPDVLGISRES